MRKTAVETLRVLFLAAGGLVFPSEAATADTLAWDVDVAFTAGSLGGDTFYEHRIVPVFEYQPEARGSLEQDLGLVGGDEGGWRLGVQRMMGQRFGVQILYGSIGFPLSGTSSPLRVDLEYTSTQPPDYIPRPVSLSWSTDWSDPEGDVDIEYVCLNGLARVRTGGRIQLAVSGGVTFFGVEAAVATLGDQTFWLGGHGVLFDEMYELEAKSERRTSVGANLGIELAVPVGDRWKVVGDVRAFSSPRVDLPLAPISVANADQVIRELSLDDVGPLSPLELDPSFETLSVGIRMSL